MYEVRISVQGAYNVTRKVHTLRLRVQVARITADLDRTSLLSMHRRGLVRPLHPVVRALEGRSSAQEESN